MRNCKRTPRSAKSVFKDYVKGQWYLVYRVNPATGRRMLEDFNRVFNDAYLTVKPRWEDQDECVRLMTYDHPEKGRAAIMFNYSQPIATVQLILDLKGDLPELLCHNWVVYRGLHLGRRLPANAPTPWGVEYHDQITSPTVPEERAEVREEHHRSVWEIFMHYLKGLYK